MFQYIQFPTKRQVAPGDVGQNILGLFEGGLSCAVTSKHAAVAWRFLNNDAADEDKCLMNTLKKLWN